MLSQEISDSRADETVLIKRANNTAESNSSLGIVCVDDRGATRVLDERMFTRVPESVSTLRYTTAAYAAFEASQNPCRENL